MPILDVEVVGAIPEDRRSTLARAIADAAEGVFRAGLQQTWVKLRELSADDYAENAGGPPKGVRPVFVSVLKHKPPVGDALRAEMAALAMAVARACDRPAEHVHVIYEPPGAGRVAFGGRLDE